MLQGRLTFKYASDFRTLGKCVMLVSMKGRPSLAIKNQNQDPKEYIDFSIF